MCKEHDTNSGAAVGFANSVMGVNPHAGKIHCDSRFYYLSLGITHINGAPIMPEVSKPTSQNSLHNVLPPPQQPPPLSHESLLLSKQSSPFSPRPDKTNQ